MAELKDGDFDGNVLAALDAILNSLNTLNVTMCRLYDVQMAALRASGANPAYFDRIEEAHEEGRFLGAPPVLADEPFAVPENEDGESPA